MSRTTAAIITLALLAACRSGDEESADSKADDEKTIRVTVAKVKKAGWKEYAEIPAVVTPKSQLFVTSRVGGTIIEMKAEEGETIMKGDLLYRLDDTDLKLQLTQALAQEKMAKAGLYNARIQFEGMEKQFKRFKNLQKSGSVSQTEFEKIETGYLSAKGGLQVAKAQLKTARSGINMLKQQLKYTKVYAPANGVILKKLKTTGELIPQMAPQPVYILADVSERFAQGNGDEFLLANLEKGQEVELVFDIFGDKTFRGVVDLLGPALDPMSKTLPVKVRITDEGATDIMPGVSAKIKVLLKQGSYFKVPLLAVRSKKSGHMTMLFVDKENKVYKKMVKPTFTKGLYFYTENQLENGELLITAAPKELAEGMDVKVVGVGEIK